MNQAELCPKFHSKTGSPFWLSNGQCHWLGFLLRCSCNLACQDPSPGFCELPPPSVSDIQWSRPTDFPHNPCEVRPKWASWEVTHPLGELDVHLGLAFAHWGNQMPRAPSLWYCAGLGERTLWLVCNHSCYPSNSALLSPWTKGCFSLTSVF